jgi:DGQHR domain-containing protein
MTATNQPQPEAAEEFVTSDIELLRYSTTQVTQGRHRFYTLTMPSDVLAKTCFVTTREEDPQEGFQRVLERARAEQIAAYIDSGFGTIPSSIVLSAQPEAELTVLGRGKTIEFRASRRAFLVLDGQHRVYGFSLAETFLRVPVVVYNGLTRQEETRLFIDINTKQRPVPNELLLDIKRLADIENDTEGLLRNLYDSFNERSDSPLLGLMSPSAKAADRITRVTFNSAMKPLTGLFKESSPDIVYQAVSAYLSAFQIGAEQIGAESKITNATMFRAVLGLFREVAQRVKDRYGSDYSADNFYQVLEPMFSRLPKSAMSSPGRSQRDLQAVFTKALKVDFTL